MTNTTIESRIKQNIDSYKEHNIPIPSGIIAWCVENDRQDLLGISPESSNDYTGLGLPDMAKLFGITLPAGYSGESNENTISDADIEAWIEESSVELARQFGVEVPKPATESKDEEYPDLPNMKKIFKL